MLKMSRAGVVTVVVLVMVITVSVQGQDHHLLTEAADLWQRTVEEKSDINFPTEPDTDTSYESDSGPDTSDIDWNETVDYLLNLANNKTESKGRSEVVLPDISKQFERKVGFLTLRGEFTAREGRMNSLSSLRRTGDVTVVKDGTAITMTCPVGLATAHMAYNHYRAKITRGPSVGGSMEAKIERNSLLVKVTLDLQEDRCVATLDEVKVVELSGLSVKVHGLGVPFDYLLTRITGWLTDVFKSDLLGGLERGLTRELTKALEKSQCERYASHFIFVSPK